MPSAHALSPRSPEPRPCRVLVTGAAGKIGTYFAAHAPERFSLRLMVRPGETIDGPETIGRTHEVVEADLGDLPRLKEVCQGVDTVLHLAASAAPQSRWADLLPNNVVGTYHVFAAAKAAGCRRVVFASSIHAVSGHPPDVQVGADDPVNPGDLYGVSKCFGEALARYMAEQEGLSAIAVRIGAFQPAEAQRDPARIGHLDAWVSPRDLTQLLVRCIDDVSIRFAIVHGVSDNRLNRLDLSSARDLLGYAPEDAFYRENPAVPDLARLWTHALPDGYASGLRDDLAPPAPDRPA